jgi:anti-anti-sigma factor
VPLRLKQGEEEGMNGHGGSKAKPAALRVQIKEKAGHLWVMLPDSLNMDNYLHVESHIVSLVQSRNLPLVIDLDKTKNMYSAGFGMIVRLLKIVTAQEKSMYIVNASKRVIEGLEGVGMHRILQVYARGALPDFLSA